MEMSDYISREAALQFVFDACAECMDSCEEFDGIYADCNQCVLEGVKLKLRDVPAADVRPVVLCRDCEMANHCTDDREMYCTLNHCYKRKNYFCADGRRKNENTD